MLKVECVSVNGLKEAVRGMRNPLNSWDKSDSELVVRVCDASDCKPMLVDHFDLGDSDRKLMHKLALAGPDHRKFMRMIVVYMDIVAPLYWWKEFDTYKVGTVANSCSTMHTLMARPLTLDDFSHDMLPDRSGARESLLSTVRVINELMSEYANAGVGEKKQIWYQVIQLLPTSFNQRRTVMMSYEAVRNMYHARKAHKLNEWHELCNVFEGLVAFDDCIA